MSDEDYRLTLPCADTDGDYVVFTRLTDRLVPKSDGLVALTAVEDGAHVVVHLDADRQRRLRDWLIETLARPGSTSPEPGPAPDVAWPVSGEPHDPGSYCEVCRGYRDDPHDCRAGHSTEDGAPDVR